MEPYVIEYHNYFIYYNYFTSDHPSNVADNMFIFSINSSSFDKKVYWRI